LLWDESADSLIVTGTTTLVGTTNLDAVDIDGATQIDATVTVGVDDTGYDVKFFGATAGAYMLWDESADDLILGGAAGLSVNSTALVTGVLTTTAATVSNGGGQFNGAINVGVDDTGYDVKFFGATTGKSLLWDESADSLTVAGNLSVDGGTIKLDGNYPVGTGNVALGNNALVDSSLSGDYNTAIGQEALNSNTSGSVNTAIGNGALYLNTTGANNISVGSNSLADNTTGDNNVAVGRDALGNNTTADNNTAVGYQAGYSNTTATHNTFIGRGSGYSTTTGGDNVALGSSALYTNAGGTSNTSIGYSSMYYNTSGTNNVALGKDALQNNTTASYNTAVGFQALFTNTTGAQNTANGYQALRLNTTGANNTANGYSALYSNTTGADNTAVGFASLESNSTGSYNTAVGGRITGYTSAVLQVNTTGASNTAMGAGAMATNTTGSDNSAFGREALRNNTTASNNTAVGYQAAYNITTGGQNTLIGWKTGHSLTTGASNTFVGCPGPGNNCGSLITTGSDNTIIGAYDGNQGGLDIRTSDNYIVLSDGDGNPRLFINGSGNINSADTYTHGMSGTIRAMYVRSDGYFGYNVSIRASKTNIEDISDASWLLQLEPKSFNYRVQNADGTYSDEAVETLSYGLIAEEVEAVNPELCYYDEVDGTPELKGVGYSELITPILKLVQQQQATITALTARITALENL
jgi:trimeric autotransporter adhesin